MEQCRVAVERDPADGYVSRCPKPGAWFVEGKSYDCWCCEDHAWEALSFEGCDVDGLAEHMANVDAAAEAAR